MSDAADLEREYRRWLRWYPTSFRREHEAEILEVLMAGAREGQRQPELMECLDLLRSALWMRLRPSVPRSDRSVFNVVKLLYFGAVVELAAAITIAATIGDVRLSIVKDNPGLTAGAWHAVVAGQLEPTAVAAGLAVGFWLWVAWSIGRGHRWARIAFALFFGLNTWGLLNGLAAGSAVYAQADLTIAIVLWLVELAALALIFRVKFAVAPSGASRLTPGG
ncbi:MAG: hypothetical protein ACLQUY_19250 [Ktedonobacterales bacterium]